MPTWDTVGNRRAQRIRVNRKRKQRDRWKVKLAKKLAGGYVKYRRYEMWKRENLRRPAPTELGNGAAWERRTDVY
jgi:hypothetical protein